VLVFVGGPQLNEPSDKLVHDVRTFASKFTLYEIELHGVWHVKPGNTS